MRGDSPIIQTAIAQLQRNYAELYKRMYELNAAQQKEIEDLKRVILTLLPQVKALEKRLSSVFTDNVEEVIDNWLDEHKQEIIDAIGEGVFVPWSSIRNSDGSASSIDATIYNSSAVYTKPEADGKLDMKVNLSQIDNGSATLTTKIYSQTAADNKFMLKTAINSAYQASGHDNELYSVGYINSLISSEGQSSPSTYNKIQIENMISSVDPGDKYVKWTEVTTAASGDSHKVYSTTVADSKFVDREELITPTSIAQALEYAQSYNREVQQSDIDSPKLLSASVVIAMVHNKLNVSDVISSYSASPESQQVYNASYVNSLISESPTDKSKQTYTADKIDSLIIEMGDDRYIKRVGETSIDNVLLTKKEGGELSLQLKGDTQSEGTIYVPNVQGWKSGDW